jgi:hypothetical protein
MVLSTVERVSVKCTATSPSYYITHIRIVFKGLNELNLKVTFWGHLFNTPNAVMMPRSAGSRTHILLKSPRLGPLLVVGR